MRPQRKQKQNKTKQIEILSQLCSRRQRYHKQSFAINKFLFQKKKRLNWTWQQLKNYFAYWQQRHSDKSIATPIDKTKQWQRQRHRRRRRRRWWRWLLLLVLICIGRRIRTARRCSEFASKCQWIEQLRESSTTRNRYKIFKKKVNMNISESLDSLLNREQLLLLRTERKIFIIKIQQYVVVGFFLLSSQTSSPE